ncbi:hypothetical protein [Pusillimonas caeni]|uniref:hypothetical protein n=1 Tax=Pusillimonas caeni TaxID=1348472 RepID=UPI001FD75CFB|nr:hypothetical protein [Pusillimonas caeni]
MNGSTHSPFRAFSGAGRMGSFRREASHLASMERVKAMTRERFELDEDTPLLVTEVACASPGCPPLETVVVFWTSPADRHQFKVFKPLHEVGEDDLPFHWMKPALIVPEGYGCDCC